MSFTVDPLLLVITGLVLTWVSVRFISRLGKRKYIKELSLIILIIFYVFSGLYYFDQLQAPFGYASGNQFMWKFGCDLGGMIGVNFPSYQPLTNNYNLLAMFIFLLYPLFLRLGIELGYILFGRHEKQTGTIYFLFPPK